MIKRIVLALTAVLCLFGAVAFAEENTAVSGTWGLTFGDSWEKAHGIMTKDNGASLLCEYVPDENFHEALYQVNFFGREGQMRLSFSPRGLYLAQFIFFRFDLLEKDDRDLTEEEKTQKMRVEVRGGNFSQLMRMLRTKYGVPTKSYATGRKIRGCLWIVGDQTISIYERRSSTKHDTVLTYEDVSRRK